MKPIRLPQGSELTIRGNVYGNGGAVQWQLMEARPNGSALIAETAVGGDRAELEALMSELKRTRR